MKDRWFTPGSVLCAIFAAALILGLAVTVTVHFRPLYYHDMEAMSIAASAGMTEADVRANYDALIDYNRPFQQGDLVFPSLPMSESGRIHFEEVKQIFDVFFALLIIGAAGLVLLGGRLLRAGRRKFLALGAVLAVAVPGAVGVLLAVAGWDRAFTVLHGVFFDNDFWVFDSLADPVILILPDGFFFHCLVMIIALIVLLAGICFTLGVSPRKNRRG
ncbi:MAG: TIGR01906 family membrane protein [Clostridiales Family XIII bacterium]|jgi:integral membrane protein (TIGR01906 family)|nr:TIGR01906 family membrane protein [Clostridiales Family XIII bacterium]